MSVLVIAEHNQKVLSDSTLRTVTAAKQLGDEVVVLVVGFKCQAVADEAAKIEGVQQVFYIDNQAYEHVLADNLSLLIAELAAPFEHILAPASTFGKDLLPRVAALLDTAQISDVILIEAKDTFKRPIYAGNAIATVKVLDQKKILTIRTSAFSAAKISQHSVAIITKDNIIPAEKTTFVKLELTKSTRPELGSAKIIISGGRGLQNGENFKLLEALADKLNAAIGASRAAVDAGFVPNDYQVGQTGKIVAPDLYIAIGISGAIQHLAGMKESKYIVAINKDEEAPIFKVADYGLVGDLFEIVPQLTAELK